ncbi:MAG: gliding motility-associated C-terminal domain-containing protein, partial [Saprospiraceae bacterium]|nr:gliding motility-associated C-terminal domain-containing protein [Saprospiraceae bacterium]
TNHGLLISCRGWQTNQCRGFVHNDEDGEVLSSGILGQADDPGLLRYTHQFALAREEFYYVYCTSGPGSQRSLMLSRHPLLSTPSEACTAFDDLAHTVTDIVNPANASYDLEEYTGVFDHSLVPRSLQGLSVQDTTICVCDTVPEIMGSISGQPPLCFDDNTGAIMFALQDGTPQFSYSWASTDGSLDGTGVINAPGDTISIPGLPSGTYRVTITDANGQELVLEVALSEPPALTAQIETSSYNGSAISCHGASDGTATVLVSGGTGQPSFLWNTGATSESITDLGSGSYVVTVTDQAGCTVERTVTIADPPPLVLTLIVSNPDCTTPVGSVVLGAEGGTGGYRFVLNDLDTLAGTTLTGLAGGTYTVSVLDLNGCTQDSTFTLDSIAVPDITVGPDITITPGDTTHLNVLGLSPTDSLVWSPAEHLSCQGCPAPQAWPPGTTVYTVSVYSADGCLSTASIIVVVDKERKIYIPNVFSPNGDGVNDFFSLYGDERCVSIIELNIFSRWGEHIYQGAGLLPSAVGSGWDGTFKGEPMPAGVYTWYAVVGFSDGGTETYSGALTLVR